MESRKNGESAVEKNAPLTGMKKGAAKAPSGGSGNGGAPAAAVLTAAEKEAKDAADRAAWDRFIELRYNFIGG